MLPNHGGDTLGSILGPMGSHWVQKMGQNVENFCAPKFEFSTTPRSSYFPKKWKLRLWRQITVGTPRVHLGANGVWLGPKNGSKRRKLPCPKIRIFDDPPLLDFSQKMEVTVMAKSRWGPPRVNLGANGVRLDIKKWVKTVKNYHAPKFEFSTTPRSSIFPKKWKLRLWRQVTVGTPRVHLGANGVPLDKKKWVKTVKNYYAPKFEFSTTPHSTIFHKKWNLRLCRQITVGTL